MAYSNFENIKADFEEKVKAGLALCGAEGVKVVGDAKNNHSSNMSFKKIGAAVSGGADSLSLLYSLSYILREKSERLGVNIPLEVITVNHYMRPKEETCGDVEFVIKCCRELSEKGFNVSCTVVELKPGAIGETACLRHGGSEDAARFLRYEAFDKFISEKNLDFLCLAHNKNDNFETILMRFLQGSNVDAGGGILPRRGKFIRPLLLISRDEIESYLNVLGCSWCNDKTNNDTNYLRNNIRHNLIPFLDENFKGWEKSVVAGAEKAAEDADIIKDVVDRFPYTVKYCDKNNCHNVESVFCSKEDFVNALPGVEKRVLIKMCNMVGENSRISNDFLKDVIHSIVSCGSQEFSKFYNNIEISVKKNLVFVKKYIKQDTDLVFFDIIEDDGVYDFPFGKLSVTISNSTVFVSVNGCDSVFKGNYPICIRNAQLGDEIKCSSGKMKKVADIYSDWHVANSDKKLIPVISCFENGCNKLKCILGAFSGYKDWIIK